MSADDVTPENVTALRGKIMEGSEGPMQKRSETQFRQQVVVDLLDAVEASWEREKALRTELSEAHGRIEFLRSEISSAIDTIKEIRAIYSREAGKEEGAT